MGKINHLKYKNQSSAPSKKDVGTSETYEAFDGIDGQHPWVEELPCGGELYQVRELGQGKVLFFNFKLAKEMGLIEANHDHKLNAKLEKKLIETFSIRIINEYDIENNISVPKKKVKGNHFMATRYLQMQHKNKQGKTSGDGRSIWNGVCKHNGVTWDVSSRGTGVTRLAPGAVEAGRPLESGNTDFGYGCGLAEVDELIGTAILAEVFSHKGLNTERILTIIDFGDGTGIGVRAAPNLIRPAHIFRYLKLSEIKELKISCDYLIDRQTSNGEWSFEKTSRNKYQKMLEHVCDDFAKFAAKMDREYIFSWLDWDGDNVLANAGIIDYGSVRLMGLRHDHYRYDDVERFSTSLAEQKAKARLTVQVFAQVVDYLKTGQKRPLKSFYRNRILKQFDKLYESYQLKFFLQHCGFTEKQIHFLQSKHPKISKQCFAYFQRLESMKTKRSTFKVADGINRPAIYNMKNALRDLPLRLAMLSGPYKSRFLDKFQFQEMILSGHAVYRDKRITSARARNFKGFQTSYKKLIQLITVDGDIEKSLKIIAERARNNCPAKQLTGNGLLFVVNEILEFQKKGLKPKQIQFVMEQLIHKNTSSEPVSIPEDTPIYKLWDSMMSIIDGHKEDI